MALTVQEVEHVALLCRIKLTEEEKQPMTEQLSLVLAHIDKLNELDTSNVEPLAHVLPIFNVFRPDKEVRRNDADAMLNNAPDAEEGMFRVPRIV
ncbi:MAG: Asp-tRNA(Asn)/Glu-tRNA(Gln) amidotransferase subunit GatC [Methylocystaceae bacterium]